MGYPRDLQGLAKHIGQPQFPLELRRYLWALQNPGIDQPPRLHANNCPAFDGKISVYHSGVARYFAPSDICGAGGMHIERVRSTPSWRNDYERCDTVFVTVDEDECGMRGLEVARVLLFFSFDFDNTAHACALVHWFKEVTDPPHSATGMWMVKPQFSGEQATIQVISIDSIFCGAHLLPIYGRDALPEDFRFPDSLDAFRAYFVNHFVDHHAYEILQQ